MPTTNSFTYPYTYSYTRRVAMLVSALSGPFVATTTLPSLLQPVQKSQTLLPQEPASLAAELS